MEQVPAFGQQGFVAQILVAGGAPDIGRDIVRSARISCARKADWMMLPLPRMCALCFGPSGPALNL
jgi:hypothetical protein